MSQIDAQDYTERLISRSPVVVQRRVLWGECDPARIVYTPRFADFLAAAFAWFMRVVVNPIRPPLAEIGLVTPMKALSLEFSHPLRPDDVFEMKVFVQSIGERTFTVLVVATSLKAEPLFRGTLTPIFVDQERYQSVRIPAAIGSALSSYRDMYPLTLD